VASPHSSSLQCPRMITPSVEPEGRRGGKAREGEERGERGRKGRRGEEGKGGKEGWRIG
jgi:hypothetical protein